MLIRLHSKIAILCLSIVICLLVFRKEQPKCEYEQIDVDISYLMFNANKLFQIIKDTNDRPTIRIPDNITNDINLERK
jgi:hypothetical protein